MSDHPNAGNFVTVEEIQENDPRLKEMLEISEEENQPSFHAIIQLMSGSDELEVEEGYLWNHCNLTNDDFSHLQALGLKGRLRVIGCGSSGYAPHKARTLIVGRHQIKEPVDLPQPNNCELIYYQEGNEWKKVPKDAPVLKRRFRLSIEPTDRNRTNLWAEAYYGSDAGCGGGAFNWDGAG